MEYKIPIPVCYFSMTDRAKNRSLFKRYVTAYVSKNHPELKIKAIKGMYIICENKSKI